MGTTRPSLTGSSHFVGGSSVSCRLSHAVALMNVRWKSSLLVHERREREEPAGSPSSGRGHKSRKRCQSIPEPESPCVSAFCPAWVHVFYNLPPRSSIAMRPNPSGFCPSPGRLATGISLLCLHEMSRFASNLRSEPAVDGDRPTERPRLLG